MYKLNAELKTLRQTFQAFESTRMYFIFLNLFMKANDENQRKFQNSQIIVSAISDISQRLAGMDMRCPIRDQVENMYAFASRGSFRVFPVGCKMFLLNLLCGMGSLGTFVIGIVFHPKLIQVLWPCKGMQLGEVLK